MLTPQAINVVDYYDRQKEITGFINEILLRGVNITKGISQN